MDSEEGCGDRDVEMSGKWRRAKGFGNHRKQTERSRGKKSPGGQTGWASDSDARVESRAPMGNSGGTCFAVMQLCSNGSRLGRARTC